MSTRLSESMRLLSNALVGAWVAMGPSGPSYAGTVPADPYAVVIDLSQPSRPLAPLLGVNRPPLVPSRTLAGQFYDATRLYREFGVESVRMHDTRLDLCEIYIDDEISNVGANPPQLLTQCVNDNITPVPPHVRWRVRDAGLLDDPTRYDFTWADEVLTSVAAVPARVYLRLGESFNGPNDTNSPTNWSRVARNIYRHAIGQFQPTPGLAVDLHAVEIHNEPDGFFWVGSDADFYDLFRQTADAIRSAASGAGVSQPVGGPGFFHTGALQLGQPATFPGGFVPAVTPARLDFLSVHFYGACTSASPTQLRNWLRQVRQSANGLGLSDKPLHISEWNIGLGQQCGNGLFQDPRMASFASGALALMHEDEFAVAAAHFYSGLPLMGLFAPVEGQARFEVNPSAWAYWAHRMLAGGQRPSTQHCRMGTCSSLANDPDRPSVLAALRPGGLYTVVTNDAPEARTLRLRISGWNGPIPANASRWIPPSHQVHTVQGLTAGPRIEVDSTSLASLLALPTSSSLSVEPVDSGVFDVSLALPARAVVLLELSTDELLQDGFETP